jgi:DNA-binding transcriptional MerR regulator
MTAGLDTGRNLRIGELSRRSGVSTELLRAWERRYELFTPQRTPSGYRLYGAEDVMRAELMRRHIESGLSAAEAARVTDADLALRHEPEGLETSIPQHLGDELERALDRLDDTAAHAALDWLFSRFTTESVLEDVVLPYLRGLGERWERGEAVIATEHFASALLRGRLLGLARGWGGGSGPRALLACVPGDQHDIGLICFGLALRGQGWRISFLGPDAPLETIVEAAELLNPDLVVIASCVAELAAQAAPKLAELAAARPMLIGGHGMDGALAERIGARHMGMDPLTSATLVPTG